jgi:very-short-patch-repair endonuclease
VLLDRAARLICTSPREPVSGVGRRFPVGGQHAAERLADTALPGRDPDPLGALYPDFLWEDLKLIGECDGAIKYNDASGYVLEKEREQVLRDLEYRFVRWLPKEIMLRPDVVMERIARALAC